MTQETLASSVALMAGTNEDAIEIAIREYAGLVYRIAYSVLRNHHDAEDATQETFVRVLRYKRNLEGVQDPKTWLARVAWRVAVRHGRKRRHGQPDISLGDDEMTQAMFQLRSQLASAEESTLGKEMARLLGSLIAALPEPLRDALRLSTVQELTPAEIARVMDVSEASVRSRIFRARQILKEKLAALEDKYAGTR